MMRRVVLAGALALALSPAWGAHNEFPAEINAVIVNPAAFYVRNITLTTSPAQLPSLTLANGVVCTPRATNVGTTYVGGAERRRFPASPETSSLCRLPSRRRSSTA